MTGVQTCALPIFQDPGYDLIAPPEEPEEETIVLEADDVEVIGPPSDDENDDPGGNVPRKGVGKLDLH